MAFTPPSRPAPPDRDLDALLVAASGVRGRSLWQDAGRALRRNRPAWWSLRILVAIGLMSFLAPLLPIPSPKAMHLQLQPQAPTWPWEAFVDPHYERDYWELSWLDERMLDARETLFGSWQTGSWLGTDAKGRDILARIVWGSRTSILVSLAAALCSLVIGVGYGALSGLVGGRIDNLMMRLVDILYSLPFIFVVIFVLTLLSGGREDLERQSLVDEEKVFFVVIGAIFWLTMARVVRGQVLSLKSAEFVDAARALGASTGRILLTHILPNVLSVAIVFLTLTIPQVMLFEAFLSFLGLGIDPPKVSWGHLAVDGIDALNPLVSFWWLVTWPALAMGVTLLALNLLGDGLRDALDPRGRERD